MVYTEKHDVATSGQGDAHDITAAADKAARLSRIRAGTITAFVVGSTAAITTIEFEPGAIADFNALLERLAPRSAPYAHHLRWGDDNGSSHARAALLGPSLTVPIVDGQLALGTWQQIMLLELDTSARHRTVVFQVIGE